MSATSRIERIRERVSDSEVTDKVAGKARELTNAMANSAGFVSWSVGRLFRPITKRVSDAYREYREEHEAKED